MFLNNLHIFVATGAETSLISLTSLPYGIYSVPLTVADQQGMATHSILRVVVCDCGEKNVCEDLLPQSSGLHGAAIGILLGSLLLMACEFLPSKSRLIKKTILTNNNKRTCTEAVFEL